MEKKNENQFTLDKMIERFQTKKDVFKDEDLEDLTEGEKYIYDYVSSMLGYLTELKSLKEGRNE